MDEATSLWILELNVKTSCSRLSIGRSFCRRSRTEMVSSSFWRSSSERFRFAAIKSAKWPGCSVFSAAILTWSVNAVDILAISSNCLCALRSIACKFDGIFRFVAQQFVARAQIRRGRRIIFDADAPQALDQHAHGAVGKFHHFGQARDAADFVQILRSRLGDVRLALQHRAEQAVAGHNVVNQLEARTGFDQQRHDGAGKNHDVGKAEDGQQVPAANAKKCAAGLPLFRRRPEC